MTVSSSAPPQSKLKRVLRIIAYVILATLVLITNVVVGAVLYLGTNRAREQVLHFGLKKLGPTFPGGVELGSSEGNLLRGLVFHNLILRDLDGRPAVMVDRVEVKYSLLALLMTRVQVDLVKVDGATIISQPLEDGRDNLSTMADVKLPHPFHPPKVLPISAALAELELHARFVKLPADVDLAHAPKDSDLRATVRAQVQLSHGMVASIDQLSVDVQTPAQARVTVQGGVHIADKMAFHHVNLRVVGDTTALRRRVEKLELSGPVTIAATADGPIDDLVSALAVDTHSPRVHLRADAHLFAQRVQLHRLALTSPFANVDASGVYHFDQTGEGKLHVDASDLRPLALFGAPKLAGSVKLDAKAKRDQQLTAEVDGLVRNFRIENDRIGQVDIKANVAGLNGHAKVQATDLSLGGTQLRIVTIGADGGAKGLKVAVDGHGPEGVDLSLAVSAMPRMVKNQLLGFEATIERVRLRAGGSPWQEDHPAHVSADFGTGTYALSALGLNNHSQHLAAEGRMMGKTIEQAQVELKHFDLSQLTALLSPGHVLPHSDLGAQLEAHGSTDAPVATAKFEGTADGRGQHDLIHFTTKGEGHLEAGRLQAKAGVTIGGQKAEVKLDMPLPLKPHQPISADFDASVLLNPWFADLLVPKAVSSQPILLYSLGAKVTAKGALSGTTSDPKINLVAHVARWGAANSHGDFGLSVDYEKRKLAASSTLTLSSLPLGGGQAAGEIQATAELPVNLAPALSGESGTLFDRTAEWRGSLNFRHVDIDRLPFEAVAILPFISHGKVDSTILLSGSAAHPKAGMKLDASGLAVSGVTGVAISGVANLDGPVTRGDFVVAVRGDQLLHAQGVVGSSELRSLHWATAPLAITVDAASFDLARMQLLKEVSGMAHGSAKITGNVAHPLIEATASVDNLKSGRTSFNKVQLSTSVKEGQVVANFAATETNGSSLSAHAEVPLAGGALAGSIDASHFLVDIQSELLPRLRAVNGELDGKLRVGGTAERPELSGKLRLARGQLVLASTAITYRDLVADLSFDSNGISVDGLKMNAGSNGSLSGQGRLTIRDLRADTLQGALQMKQVPLQWDTTSGLVDGKATLDGKRDHKKGGFDLAVKLDQARVDLLDDHGTKGLIGMPQLEDIKVGKAKPEPVSGPIEKPKTAPHDGKYSTLAISGPLVVHGTELDATIQTDVRIDLASDIPTADGTLTFAPHGVARLFGQQYDLERGRVGFGNIAQPDLAIRLSRAVPRARIGVDLAGSVRQPTTTFWSAPTAYAPGQVAALITGQPGGDTKVDKEGLDHKATGPLSHLIALALRQSHPATKVVDVTKPQPAPTAPKQ